MGDTGFAESAINVSSFSLNEILAIHRETSVGVNYVSNQAHADQTVV